MQTAAAELGVTAPLVACIACGGELSAAERLGSQTLAACRLCGTWSAVPRPRAKELIQLHDSSAYFSKEYFEARRMRHEVTEARFARLDRLLCRHAATLKLAGRPMLDVGCDAGDFAVAAQQRAHVEPFGIDVAGRPLAAARTRGVRAWHGELATAPAAFCNFALVTAIDVLEHVADPVDLLREMQSRLAPDGVIYLETPNIDSFVYRLGRALANLSANRPHEPLDRLFPPEHVQYFSEAGLRAVAARAGLKPLSVFRRDLGGESLAGGTVLRAAMRLLQTPDRVRNRGILLCALFEPVKGS